MEFLYYIHDYLSFYQKLARETKNTLFGDLDLLILAMSGTRAGRVELSEFDSVR